MLTTNKLVTFWHLTIEFTQILMMMMMMMMILMMMITSLKKRMIFWFVISFVFSRKPLDLTRNGCFTLAMVLAHCNVLWSESWHIIYPAIFSLHRLDASCF